MKKRQFLISIIILVSMTRFTVAQVQHPLDPLTWQEHWTLLEVLQEENKLDSETRFSMVNLEEPPKNVVLEWSGGQPIPRSAMALVRQKEKSFKAIIDLNQRKISSWEEIIGHQPNWLGEEFGSIVDEVKKDPQFLEALRKRGIEETTFIDCFASPPGYYGTEEQQGKRIAHVSCNDVRGVRNTWTRGIEGLVAVVDMNEKKILRIVDEGVVPVPGVSADYDPTSIGPSREVPGPILQDQPVVGFKLEGHTIEWQNWKFHVRPDHRVGMVISNVTYKDGDETRSILYQGHLSEIFVPYMDPAINWYWRNFLDAGEYTAGGLTKPLIEGADCPDNTVFIPALIAGDNGRPQHRPRMIGIFEREAGEVAWRHYTGAEEGGPESRVKRDLVVRSAAVLGNYDYLFDWVFQQDGSIRVGIGATGIAEVKMVNQSDALAASTKGGRAAPPEKADAYGRFVDPNIVAVNHDHYFSYRLDLDVDGTDNNLQLDRLVMKTLPEDHPRRSVWVTETRVAQTESDAKMNINLDRPTYWRVTGERKNHVGYPSSYQIMPGMNGNTLLSEDDYPRRRAGFINHHLWATPYQPGERYAAGEYPTLSEPGQGLPEWTSKDRKIADTDLVLWYTIGMHHLVRGEDWPVMPVLWHEFELRPFDFFDYNPAMDLPK